MNPQERLSKLIEKAECLLAKSDALTIAYLCEDGSPRASTISIMKAEGIRTICMSTAMQALKTKRIQRNPRVSLCVRSGSNNVTLTGTVAVSQDDVLRKALWKDWCIQHFPDGATGKSFCILIFTMEEATFWIDGEGGVASQEAL